MIIFSHLGLGDMIICNAIVRRFALQRDHVEVICKFHNVESVKWMYGDQINVKVVGVADHDAGEQYCAGAGQWVLRLGSHGQSPFESQDFDKGFFRQAGVPFEQRWEGFHVPRDRDIEIKFSNPHIFVHDDPERGMAIRPLDIYKRRSVLHRFEPMFLTSVAKGYVENIFAFWHAIEFASEIHCIPSSFSVWIDSMQIEMKGTPLFLHGSARPGCELPTYRKPWTIL